MSRKTLLALLAAVLAFSVIGCQEEEPVATEPNAADRGMGAGTERAQEGTDTGVARVPEGTSPEGGATGTTQAQQAYIAGTEKMLSNIEQQAQSTAQAQVPEQDREKVQQLQQELQQEIADAREALNKLRDAGPDTASEQKVAVDDAMSDVQNTYKELQSVTQGRQVTQEPPQQPAGTQ